MSGQSAENDVTVGEVLDAIATIDAPAFTALLDGHDRDATITVHNLPGRLLLLINESRECDHPGFDHDDRGSHCWPCPRCKVCKFIGHGPLCIDCATQVMPTEKSGE